MYFGKLCRQAGVPQYVDTTFETPHLALIDIDHETFEAYLADHPEETQHPLQLAHVVNLDLRRPNGRTDHAENHYAPQPEI